MTILRKGIAVSLLAIDSLRHIPHSGKLHYPLGMKSSVPSFLLKKVVRVKVEIINGRLQRHHSVILITVVANNSVGSKNTLAVNTHFIHLLFPFF
jgi:hypothetical protein